MGKWIIIGVLCVLLFIFCIGFKWIAIQAIHGFEEQEGEENE